MRKRYGQAKLKNNRKIHVIKRTRPTLIANSTDRYVIKSLSNGDVVVSPDFIVKNSPSEVIIEVKTGSLKLNRDSNRRSKEKKAVATASFDLRNIQL